MNENIKIIKAVTEEEWDAGRVMMFADYIESKFSRLGINFNYMVMRGFSQFLQSGDKNAMFVAKDELTDKWVGAIAIHYAPACASDPMAQVATEMGWYTVPEYRGQGIGWMLADAVWEEVKNRVLFLQMGVPFRDGLPSEKIMESFKNRGFIPHSIRMVKRSGQDKEDTNERSA